MISIAAVLKALKIADLVLEGAGETIDVITAVKMAIEKNGLKSGQLRKRERRVPTADRIGSSVVVELYDEDGRRVA
jgi:hypothetical protein